MSAALPYPGIMHTQSINFPTVTAFFTASHCIAIMCNDYYAVGVYLVIVHSYGLVDIKPYSQPLAVPWGGGDNASFVAVSRGNSLGLSGNPVSRTAVTVVCLGGVNVWVTVNPSIFLNQIS